jgi:uncharacterized membrane protein
VSTGWGYALLCVTVPALWGLVMVAVFERWERRYGRRSHRRRIDYSI